MLSFNDLLKDLSTNIKKKSPSKNPNLSGTNQLFLGFSIPELKKLVEKYKDLDYKNIILDNTFDLSFIFFSIAFNQANDFEDIIELLNSYSFFYEGWMLTDSTYQYIKLDNDFNEIYKYLLVLLDNKNQYIRRLAYLICFKYLKDKQNLPLIFKLFKNDEAYYVQMVESWLLCELYIHYKNNTFNYIESSNLDKIIVNKTISKINDSFRVNKEDKAKAKLLKNKGEIMNNKERMLKGKLYNSSDSELIAAFRQNRSMLEEFNQTSFRDGKRRGYILRAMLKSSGKYLHIEPPFYCDYGVNITVGDNFYANVGCVIIDDCEVNIGNNVFLGPRVILTTATSPIDKDVRNTNLEYGLPINIGNDVFIGAGAIINPGVTIHDDVVVGSGSVVTHDLESHGIYAGNPAQKIRDITDEERSYWKKEADLYRKEMEK